MSQSVYHDQIKSAILDQLSERKQLHKRDIKSIIDNVKNHYLWNSKIKSDELGKIVSDFKNNWQDFKSQARNYRKSPQFMNFRRYQI